MTQDNAGAEPMELACPRCGPVMVAVPLIVDLEPIAQRAELEEAIRSGAIHEVVCPGCGSPLAPDAPLLLHVPEPEPILVFSPAQATTAEQDQEAARVLVERWQRLRGKSGSDESLAMVTVSRERLPVMLAEGVAATLKRDVGNPDDPLIPILRRFMETVSWHDAYRIAREHPEFMAAEANSLYAAMRENTRVFKQHAAVRALEEDIALRRRCQEVGIENAFAEKLGCTADELQQLAPGLSLPIRDLLEQSDKAEQLYLRTGDLSALDEAAAHWEHLLFPVGPGASANGGPGRHIRKIWRLGVCDCAGNLFLRKHEARGTLADLDRALVLLALALEEVPVDSPDWSRHVCNLGVAYRTRYDHTGQMEDLQTPIALYRQALDAASPDSPDRAYLLTELGTCIRKRYERTGQVEDLEEAIELYRQALDAAPASSPARLRCIVGLGNGLMTRYARSRDAADGEQAIELYRQALDATPAGSAERLTNLANLAQALHLRHERTGQMEDLQESIALHRQAFAAISPASPKRWKILETLGDSLLARYGRTGRMEDLEETITLHRQALDAVPTDSPNRPSLLRVLGSGLSTRHRRLGRIEDLEEAIALFREALDTTPPDIPTLAWRLNNLATCLRTRHDCTGRMEDLEEAIGLFRRARTATASDSPHRAMILNNLGAALRKRYESTEQLGDLQEAIALFRYNVDITAPDSPGLPILLANLGNGLGTCYKRTGRVEDLQEAIAVYRRALDAIPADSPDRPMYLRNLGNWLGEQYESTGRIEDLTEANAVHREAAQLQRELDSAAGTDRGYAFPLEVTCAQCGPVTVNTQLIVDLDAVQQRPDLVDAIRGGTIHRVTCSGCGTVLGVDAPLLLHCPGPEPSLVFSPAQTTTPEEDQQVVAALVEQWRRLTGAREASAIPRVIAMPRGVLPVVVSEGLEVARARLAELAQRVDPVEAAVGQLVRASTWEQVYGVIRDHADLADERADMLLCTLRDRARAAGDEAFARRCEQHAGLLRRCSEIGVQGAFIEKVGWTSIDMEELDAMAHLPRSIQDAMREAEWQEERYVRTRNLDALTEAAACWERVLSHPERHLVPLREKVTRWTRAGALFLHNHQVRGELSDLNRAVTVWREALEMSPPDASIQSGIFNNLGIALKARYEQTARLEELEEAIAFYRHAVDACPSDSPYRQAIFGNLGAGILKRYERTGRADDLEEAIAVCRRSVDIGTTDPHAVNGLVAALRRRYDRMGNLEDLDEIIAICRQARDPGAPDRLACLHNLGVGLITRYERLGKLEDLENAILAFRQDLDAIPANSPDWVNCLASLGSAVSTRYEQTGRIEDLHEAIAILRRAVNASPNGPVALSNLSNSLRKRYGLTGRMEDLQEGIALLRRAINASAPDSPEHPWFLNNLGVALHQRYDRTDRPEDLQESIALCRQAVQATPPDSPDRPKFLGNVGWGLNAQYYLTGKLDDLREATAACREAVAGTSTDAPDRAIALGNLATCLSNHYDHTGRIEDLEEAIAVRREELAARSLNSPQRPSSLYNLARELHDRYEHSGRIDDLKEAIAVSQQALELGRTLAPDVAVLSAHAWGLWSLQQSAWEDAASAYDEAMTLMEMLCEAQLLRADKYNWLREARQLYAEAAYSKARLGDFQGAVLALETGRARLLAERLDRTRAHMEEVEKQAPELVHRYRQMLAQLRQLEGMAASGPVRAAPGNSESRLPEQIREAHAELHATVDAIRAALGGESFLARPSVDALAASLEPRAPVVYLAATAVGGIALVVSSEDGRMEVAPLWLDSMTIAAVFELLQGSKGDLALESWLGAYRQWLQYPNNRRARVHWHDTIIRTTRALWDIAMGPVVALLKKRFTESEQAVLIPDGLLALLPLHAAWTDADGGRPHWALDDVAFRYAPSLRALAHARHIAGSCGQTRLLAVDDPQPTSASPLPNSQHEVEAAAAQFAPGDVTVLSGGQCRRDEVLAAIAEAHICHFSCHGMNHWHNPLESGLLMANDEMLTVADLFTLHGNQARLAVLSACETGVVGTDAPNEVVALPAAFLQAGFACVVASLWSVYDISASLLMARFYELWRKEQLPPAVALRRAQVWLRDLTNRDLAAHLEQVVPQLVPRMSLETAETLHLRALLQDPDACSFAGPVHWAAFYVTGV